MTTTANRAAVGSQTGNNGSAGTGAAAGGELIPINTATGIVLIPRPTELTRLNYYDGKFLRASDLTAEQQYLRNLVALSNRAGGSGVVHGFDVRKTGTGTLTITSGLAIDPQGRVLWLPYDAPVNVLELIERSREGAADGGGRPAPGGESFGGCATEGVTATPPVNGVLNTDLYVITACWAEALCGESDVYGRLCEDACISSTDRPFRLEGVVLRALPLTLGPPSCNASWLDERHRRSLVASAWFAGERAALGAPMSGTRLRNGPWCFGATAAGGECVQLGVVAVNGGNVLFLDEWTARRERIEMPPLRYWQWQLDMRPKAVFLAQLLQFQCQLRDVLTTAPPTPGEDPCASQRALLRRAERLLGELKQQYRARDYIGGRKGESYDADRPALLVSLSELHDQVGATLTQLDAVQDTRVLLEGGIVELPPTGYLPVVPGPVDVKTQVQRLLGEGVEIRVCSVRPDFVPHALEEAQHMERICLVQGLENPQNRPKIDVLVPDGVVTQTTVPVGGIPMSVRFRFEAVEVDPRNPNDTAGDVLTLNGAARAEALEGGGAAFHFAGRGELLRRRDEPQFAQPLNPATGGPIDAVKTPAPTAPSSAQPTAGTPERGPTSGVGINTNTADLKEKTADSTAFSRFFARRRTEARITTRDGGVIGFQERPPTSPPQSSPPQSSPPEGETADFSPAAWATVRVGGDPFSLGIGDSLPLHGEFAMSFQEGGRRDGEDRELTAAEIVIDADLYRDQGTGGTLRGRARGFVVFHDPGEPPESEFESLPVEIELQPAGNGGGTLVATLRPNAGEIFRFVTTWTPRPAMVTADGDLDWVANAIARADTEAERETARRIGIERPALHHLPFLHAEALENPEVLKAGNAYHERAVSALTELQELLREPGFRAAGEARLFAADKQVPAETSVRATRDWVLFHRRRDNTCDCTCPHDATVVLRRYRLYHAQVPQGTTLAEIRAALAGTRPIDGMATVAVLPRYAADGAELLTPRREVLQAWSEMDLGSEIVYGAIAAGGAGTADPPGLLDGRIETLGTVLDDATPDPRAVYEVLASIPPTLDAGGLDGVMVIITVQAPVETHCHAVYALGDQGTMDSILDRIGKGEGLFEWLRSEGNATLLGSAHFDAGSATPNGPLSPLLDAWRDRWPDGQNALRAVTVIPVPGAPAMALQQGAVIARTFGIALTEGAQGTREAPWAGPCPVITLFEPGFEEESPPRAVVCHTAYRLNPGQTVIRLAEMDAGRVAAELAAGGLATLLGTTTFFEDTDQVEGSIDGIRAAWGAGGGPVASITFGADGPPRSDFQAGQARTILQALGGSVLVEPRFSRGTLDLDCPVVSFLESPPGGNPTVNTECQTAFLLSAQAGRQLREQVAQGMPIDVGFFAERAVRGPFTVNFDAGTTNLTTDKEKVMDAVGATQPGFVAVVPPGTSTAAMRRAHERAMITASVAGNGPTGEELRPMFATTSTLPGGCGAVTLLIADLA